MKMCNSESYSYDVSSDGGGLVFGGHGDGGSDEGEDNNGDLTKRKEIEFQIFNWTRK